ncbi:MAG: hypothetical protein SLRJCFUN_002422 [Candidatus Fervidibacter sp.]
MEQAKGNSEVVARWMGLLVFLLGIGLMLMVFVWAARLFNELGVGKGMVVQGNPDDRTALWDWLARWLVRVALLFVLGYLASLIAARGANFYLAARTTPKE